MKRTLTAAAAVLVGGAGAVGFAGAANAEPVPMPPAPGQLPAELPTDNNLAQTAFHAAGTLHSAQQTVGDVIPLDKQLTGRSGDPVGDLTGGLLGGLPAQDLLGGLTGVAGKSGEQSNAVTGLPEQLLGTLPVGDVVPVAHTMPVGRSGATDMLPPGVAPSVDQLKPTTKPAQLPQQQLPQDVDVVGETLNGVVNSTPLGRVGDPTEVLGGGSDVVGGLTGNLTQGLPVGKAAPGGLPLEKVDPVLQQGTEQVGNLVAHGPLGGNQQLGG
ncbi:hypothetical protein OU415_05080 [Saccharopolyspora sp. WRP15-2]|uniref:ATP-binding protein n=1 Tax=Saccharopolyspora oryzae TaxID=2997343 RepID=A0ABT4USV2_9PSEU|nr:hypothetical protein [Saccharopolyspora oryzae]MDA3624802.1 hypothetical protein [Saccharopolyspora oryzae]